MLFVIVICIILPSIGCGCYLCLNKQARQHSLQERELVVNERKNQAEVKIEETKLDLEEKKIDDDIKIREREQARVEEMDRVKIKIAENFQAKILETYFNSNGKDFNEKEFKASLNFVASLLQDRVQEDSGRVQGDSSSETLATSPEVKEILETVASPEVKEKLATVADLMTKIQVRACDQPFH